MAGLRCLFLLRREDKIEKKKIKQTSLEAALHNNWPQIKDAAKYFSRIKINAHAATSKGNPENERCNYTFGLPP